MKRIVGRTSRPLDQWLEIFETDIQTSHGIERWHTIKPADYVTGLVRTLDGEFVLIRQLRAVGADYTIEFPGGLLEKDETPESCIRREIFEEAGFEVGELHQLACMIPDSGRLENKLHAFFADQCSPIASWVPEDGIELVQASKDELREMIISGNIFSAITMSIIAHAIVRGKLNFE